MRKKLIALLLAVAVLATCFAGCVNSYQDDPVTTVQTTTAKQTDDVSFKLSYTQGDSLDPFKATSQNNQVLASLVFESLFDLDEHYEPIPNIASGYEFTDSKTLKVDIKPTLKFSDGSQLDTEDVVYSINAAKKSDAYASSLTGIKSCYADGSSVIISLSYANPFAVNLLTFPIASVNDDKDGFPVGNGRYKYQTSGNNTVLVVNENSDFDPYITTITLVNIAAADSIDNAVNIGNISFSFKDMSVNPTKRMSCAKKAIDMNNLVYIGVNSKRGITTDAQIRKTISLAVDRKTLVESAYSGYAQAALSVFHPQFTGVGDTNLFSETADTTTAKQTLAQTGYESKDLTLTLIVDKNDNKVATANLVKNQLEAAGFKINIEQLSSSDYQKRVKSSNFDLYIGEVKLADDMNLYPFLAKNGGVNYGIDLDHMSCDDTYTKYLESNEELGKFILAFYDDMPYIPLLYKKGLICYSKSMKGDMQGYYGNFFSNIDSWNFSS